MVRKGCAMRDGALKSKQIREQGHYGVFEGYIHRHAPFLVKMVWPGLSFVTGVALHVQATQDHRSTHRDSHSAYALLEQ